MAQFMQEFNAWRAEVYGYGPAMRIALAVGLVLMGIFAARLFRKCAQWLYKKVSPHMPEWLRIITAGFLNPAVLMLRFLCWYLAVFAFPWPASWCPVLYPLAGRLIRVAIICMAALGFWNAAGVCCLLLRSAQNKLDMNTNKTMNLFLERIYRAVVVVLALIVVLSEFKFDVTGIITGAGLVGLTLSLAAQSTVSNLVAGIALVMERPFGIGDYITVGTTEGFVEDISFRSTRIRTVDNALVTMENSAVCAASISNISGRKSRMYLFTIGLRYDTPRSTVDSLCLALQDALKQDAQVVPEKTQVWFSGFGASSLDVSIQCYLTAVDLSDYRAAQGRLNALVMDVVAAQGCDFAFPSTSLYIESSTDVPLASPTKH